MQPQSFVFEHLKDIVSGNAEMNVNGAVTPVSFRITAPQQSGVKKFISRLNLSLFDLTITLSKFGGIAALTNGLTIKAFDSDDVLLIDLLDGWTIKRNGDWSNLAGIDVNKSSIDDHFGVRWTLFAAGQPFHLTNGQYIEILVQDDLSAINDMHILAQGYNNPG